MAKKKAASEENEEAGAVNVAARKIMVRWTGSMGSVVKYAPEHGKVISMGRKYVTVRPINEARPFDMPLMRFNIAEMEYSTYMRGWSTHYRFDDESVKVLHDLYVELFKEEPPKSKWQVGDNE